MNTNSGYDLAALDAAYVAWREEAATTVQPLETTSLAVEPSTTLTGVANGSPSSGIIGDTQLAPLPNPPVALDPSVLQALFWLQPTQPSAGTLPTPARQPMPYDCASFGLPVPFRPLSALSASAITDVTADQRIARNALNTRKRQCSSDAAAVSDTECAAVLARKKGKEMPNGDASPSLSAGDRQRRQSDIHDPSAAQAPSMQGSMQYPQLHSRRHRRQHPTFATHTLRHWLAANAHRPYPTPEEKQALCRLTGLAMTQLNDWFVNARRRVLPRGHSLVGPLSSASMTGIPAALLPVWPRTAELGSVLHSQSLVAPIGPVTYAPEASLRPSLPLYPAGPSAVGGIATVASRPELQCSPNSCAPMALMTPEQAAVIATTTFPRWTTAFLSRESDHGWSKAISDTPNAASSNAPAADDSESTCTSPAAHSDTANLAIYGADPFQDMWSSFGVANALTTTSLIKGEHSDTD